MSLRPAPPFVSGGLPAAALDEPTSWSQAGPFVAVPVLLAALRRGRRWCAGAAALGAVVGLAIALAYPPPHKATTTVLLRHQTQTDPARAMVTDAQLLETRTVARGAIERLGLRMAPGEMVDDYEPRILSDSLLRITVSGPTADEAVRRADAVAASFLAFRAEELRRQSRLAIGGLEARERQLSAELTGLNERIAASVGGSGDSDVRALGVLLERRSSINSQLDELRRRIDAGAIEVEAMTEQSRVVDPAGVEHRSLIRTTAFNVVPGVVLGLALAAGWIVLREITTHRVRRRDDVMAALGAPVAVSTAALGGRRWAGCRRLRRQLASPPPDAARVVPHLRRVLSRSATAKPALVVVSVDSDVAAALAVAWTASETLTHGDRVLVVDLSRGAVLRRLSPVADGTWELPVPGDGSGRFVPSAPLHAGEAEATARSERYRRLVEQADVVLALATLDPAVGADHLVHVAGTAVAVVTAGRSSATALRAVAQMLRAAGLTLDSTILVGADVTDETAGVMAPPSWTPVPDAPPWRDP